MRVVDSSAWIERLRRGPLAAQIDELLPTVDVWVVPTIVLFELTKWAERERGEEIAAALQAFCQDCRIVPLDADLAVSAAWIAREHKLATADAIIYATARTMNADLLTCDAHFDGLDGVVYLPKRA